MIQSLKNNQITFCKRKNCCPTVEIKEDGNFLIGGVDEGYSVFTKENFQDFVEAVKNGKFDHLI